METGKEIKAYAIEDDFKFQVVEVVVCHSKDVAMYWLKEQSGYTGEEMKKFKISEFPLDKKVFIRDYGETTARELLSGIKKYPAVVFSKVDKSDYYQNWLSHYEREEPNDG